MLMFLTSKIVDQVIVPGSLFWKREKRALVRRWKRAMLLPETILLAGLIIISGAMVDGPGSYPGPRALASNAVVQDGIVAPATNKRQQRLLQDNLQSKPEGLMKLSGSDAVQAFSYADLQRREGDMLILQFRGRDCVLDVYYREGGDQTTHYEFRARQMAALDHETKVNARRCVDDIIKSRRV